jgi:hypothetical protein
MNSCCTLVCYYQVGVKLCECLALLEANVSKWNGLARLCLVYSKTDRPGAAPAVARIKQLLRRGFNRKDVFSIFATFRLFPIQVFRRRIHPSWFRKFLAIQDPDLDRDRDLDTRN